MCPSLEVNNNLVKDYKLLCSKPKVASRRACEWEPMSGKKKWKKLYKGPMNMDLVPYIGQEI